MEYTRANSSIWCVGIVVFAVRHQWSIGRKLSLNIHFFDKIRALSEPLNKVNKIKPGLT